MAKGVVQAADKAAKEAISNVGQINKIVMKSDRRRMQKEAEAVEKQTKLHAGAVNNDNCMYVNLAFDTNTTNGRIHGNDINTTRK